MVFSITNQKGGVGKTTLSINLSSALALLGHRVLLIDMDPQGNATEGLGLKASSCEYTIYDVLINDTLISETVVQHQQKNLYVVPSDIGLFGAEAILATKPDRYFCLRQAIQSESAKYDYIVIDCPPNLGVLTINAIIASTDIIVPLEPNTYALKGMSGLFNAMLKIKDELRYYPNLLGVAINMFNPINALHKSIVKNVTASFPPGKVFTTKIQRNSIISEAEIYGQSTLQYAPHNIATELFINLAEEIIHQNNGRKRHQQARAIR